MCQAGVYVKMSGLYNKPSDVHVNSVSSFRASLKSNVGLSAALGYKFSLLRVEAEFQRLRSGVDSAESSGTLVGGVSSSVGSIKETAGFANGYLDLPSFVGLSPYVGIGAGYARINLDGVGRLRNNVPVTQFSGSEAVFGYQAMLGLQFRVFGTATINAGYRIIKRQDIAVREVVSAATQSLKLGDNRMFELGLSVGF
jgi:opacity protein-like surface antigen